MSDGLGPHQERTKWLALVGANLVFFQRTKRISETALSQCFVFECKVFSFEKRVFFVLLELKL